MSDCMRVASFRREESTAMITLLNATKHLEIRETPMMNGRPHYSGVIYKKMIYTILATTNRVQAIACMTQLQIKVSLARS